MASNVSGASSDLQRYLSLGQDIVSVTSDAVAGERLEETLSDQNLYEAQLEQLFTTRQQSEAQLEQDLRETANSSDRTTPSL